MTGTSEIPAFIGRYRIEAVLGRGAMGVVYKAHDPTIDRPVALKTVRTELIAGDGAEELRSRFRREARAAGRCMHPNIVAVFDFSDETVPPFIAMEYVQGQELAQFVKQGVRFERSVTLYIIAQVLSALDYAHALGIVHRDIKPANVIVLQGGRIKVADFGIARLEAIDLTQSGAMIGTPSYMAPEQFTGGPVDHRADLFAAGVMLFELLSGSKPFPGSSATEIMYRVLHHPPLGLAAVGADVPPALEAVLARALARDVAQRFQSAGAFATALRTALGEATGGLDLAPADQTALMSTLGSGAALGDAALVSAEREVLERAEADLANYIGPIAKVLVRRAAQESTSIAALYDRLAEAITTDADREAFLARARRLERGRTGGSSGGRAATGTTTDGADPGFDPAVLAALSAHLTHYMGPIAAVLVRRTARRSATLDALVAALADEIDDAAARAAFLAAAGSTLATGADRRA